MRKFGKKSATPSGEGDTRRSSKKGEGGWFRKNWLMTALFATIIVAFVIRFVFAYGISAGDNYALSGGSSASSHLNTVISILTGSFAVNDPSVNFPIGSLNVNPPLFDYVIAGLATVVKMAGVSAATAAAGTLAWTAPIFSALTCIPVYFVGKRMFKDDKIALLSAVFYAFFALMIMTTAFSNGTEYAFIGFVFAWMVYFLVGAMQSMDSSQSTGFKALFSEKAILKNTLLAGLCFLIIALSWSDFRVLLGGIAFIMIAQAFVDRFRSKDISLTVAIYSTVILMGAVVSAVFYIPAGLWSAVFSGPFMLAIIVVALMMVFALTAKKSWVLMIPVLAIILAAILVALFFAAPSLFNELVMGNSTFSGTLYKSLTGSGHTSMSAMAAYFGWVTVWTPLLAFAYMLYKYRSNMDSKKYSFTMWFVIVMFFMAWFSTGNAVVAGIGFAVSSAVLTINVIRWADLKTYLSGLRGNGFAAGFKKALKPVPFAVLVIVAALVIAPNVVYAIDAATPTNSEKQGDYFGGLGYTIQTKDSSSMSRFWDAESSVAKSGALLTWYNYTSDASSKGRFNSVTDMTGGGTAAMSSVLLSNGSSSATASMAVRIMLSHNFSDYSSAITTSGLNYSVMEGYVKNPATAVAKITSDIKKYPGIDSKMTSENAIYVVLTEYIASSLCGPDIDAFYNLVCNVHNDKISYVLANGSMIPMYYKDGSYFPSIGYFGSYLLGQYGAIPQFFTFNKDSGYAEYTDAMYETFIWKALIGPGQKALGYSSTPALLNDLAISDGTLKAMPGYGLNNYKVAYWHVMYNPDKDAKMDSKGWVDKDGLEAINLQKTEGGVINYLAGVVLMEYAGGNTQTYSGKINYTAPAATPAKGVEVAVYTQSGYDFSKKINNVPVCIVKTLADGTFKIDVPTDKPYYIVVSTGASTTAGGTILATYTNVNDLSTPLLISATGFSGNVSSGSVPYTENAYVKIEGKTSGYIGQVNAVAGAFSFSNIMPDLYTVSAYKADGTVVAAKELNVPVGNNTNAMLDAKSGKISVTVTDDYGNSVLSGTVVAMDTATGHKVTATIVDGKADMSVVPSKYNVSATNGKISVSTTSVDVTADSTKTATLSVFDSKNITVSGVAPGSMVTIMSFGFVGSSTTSAIPVPVSGAGATQKYTAYAVEGNTVYYGVNTGDTIAMTGHPGSMVSGTMKDSAGKAVAGTVTFTTGNATFIFAANSSGEYKVMLPNGPYTVYAYSESGSAFVGSYTVSSAATNDITLESGRSVSATINYNTQQSSGATKGIPFADVKVKAGALDIVIKTDSAGLAKFNVPASLEVTVSVDAFDNVRYHFDAVTKTFSAGTSAETVTWTLSANPAGTAGMYVKLVSVSSPYAIKLTLYSDSTVTYNFTGTSSVQVGRYTAEVSGSTGYYFNGSVYVYPGVSGPLVMDGKTVSKVTLVAGTQDAITVTPVKKDDGKVGSYFKDSADSLVYYVEKGYSYAFVAKAGSTGTVSIAYASVQNIAADATLSLNAKSTAVTLKGYVGVVADGTVVMKYPGAEVPFDVKSGEFEISAPKDKAIEFTATVTKKDKDNSKITYTYTGTASVAALTDDSSIRFYSTKTGAADETGLTGSAGAFADGKGKFTLKVENKGDYANTYTFGTGHAWILDKSYLLTVPAKSSATIELSGKYYKTAVGAGNNDFTVIVKDISGNSVGTYKVDGAWFAKSTSSSVYVDVSGTKKAFSDAASTYEYMYAVTLTNNDGYLKSATFAVTVDGTGWTYILADESQQNLSKGAFNLKGYGSTVVYVKVMCTDGKSTTVPKVTVVATVAGETLATNSSSAVTVSGSTATMSLSPQSIDIKSSDPKATGTDIYNTPSTVPMTFWVLMIICVLVLVFVAWVGSKRGVFARRK